MPSRRRKDVRSLALNAGPQYDPALVLRGLSLARSYEGLPEGAFGVAWSADGSFVAAGGSREAAIWSAATGKRRLLDRSLVSGNVYDLAWHPARLVLAIGGRDGYVHITEMGPGNPRRSFSVDEGAEGKGRSIRGLAWSPDGSTLAVTYKAREINDRSGGIGIWDAQTLTLIKDIRHQEYCCVPCWSPDGRLIVAPGANGDV